MLDILPTIKAAAVQAEPVVLDREATVAKACQLISESAANGAQLIIFPEMFIPTFTNSAVWGRGLSNFGSANAKRAWSRLWQNSVEIPSHTTDRLCKAASDAKAVWDCTNGNLKVDRSTTPFFLITQTEQDSENTAS